MSTNLKYVELNKKLITALDKLLATGNWQVSLFLKAASKQISDLRNQAEQLLIEATGSAMHPKNTTVIAKPGYTKVFVSVHQAVGNNLPQWHRTLKSIATYSIGRPIYREEEHIKTMIRSKTDKQREGYVAIFIKDEDILPSGREMTDRLGYELLTVKMGAVKPENIVEFIHCNKVYSYNDDDLLLQRDVLEN